MKKVTAPRKRSTSTQARIEAMQSAAADVLPVPEGVSLAPLDLPFWRAITEARPRTTWTAIDLIHAATLARTLRAIEQHYSDEAPLSESDLDRLSRRAIAMSRMLHVHALATVGRSGDASGLAAMERQARAMEQDDLIPMGPMQ